LAKAQTLTGEVDRAEIGKALTNTLFHDVVRQRFKLQWEIAEATVRARLDKSMEATLSREAIAKFEAAAHNKAADRKQ
jgi:hypothetical protein